MVTWKVGKWIVSAVTMVGMCIIAAVTSGCNKRIYIGMDDYGETKSFHSDYQTGNGRSK